MTSKRKLRAEIERLTYLDRLSSDWLDGFEVAAAIDLGNTRPWAAHLARVADAAREQGRQEGWTQVWADIAADVALLRDMDHQPQPETTPETAEPSADEVNRFSADGPCCGFACCCQHPPVAGWAPGSVTR